MHQMGSVDASRGYWHPRLELGFIILKKRHFNNLKWIGRKTICLK